MTDFNPSIYSLAQTPLPSDSHPSATLTEQQETEHVVSSLIATTAPPASPTNRPASRTISPKTSTFAGAAQQSAAARTVLRKNEHSQYLASLFFELPAGYVGLDASRPWLMFWTTHSWDLLGVALDQETKNRAVSTMLHMLHPSGGFGGGPSNTQLPHLLPTYAAVSSLAIVGGPGPSGGWEQLAAARQSIYNFFMRCKRPDGGFDVCQGGEVDVRGTYCLLVVATLLDLLTPELLHNVDRFISACQTFEGGFACSTFLFPSFPGSDRTDSSSRAAMAEAHGGYSSCALNSHFLLRSVRPEGHTGSLGVPGSASSLDASYPSPVDSQAALRWSVMMQAEAIEGGGFRGRSNKLVDGCYSWWVGGGVPVVAELVRREKAERTAKQGSRSARGKIEMEGDEGEWEDVAPAPPLFNRAALQEYILVAAQKEAGGSGGLRDKPGKRPDQYHTCNNLSGLSVAQHNVVHSPALVATNRATFDPSRGLPAIKPVSADGGWASEDERQAVRREVWSNALGWVEEGEEFVLGGKESRTNTTAPVFNILLLRLKPFINYSYCQGQQ